jgi:hypothetical protein
MTTNVVIRFAVDRAILIGWYGLGIFGARRGLPRREEEHEGWAGMRVWVRGGFSQRREDAKGVWRASGDLTEAQRHGDEGSKTRKTIRLNRIDYKCSNEILDRSSDLDWLIVMPLD